jgi:uncharacterized protein
MQGKPVFHIHRPEDFITTPWKNGGGLTHEIARAEGAKGWLWRLSIAEVATDGPFSRFDGYARILTVIEGAGIALHGPDHVLSALPLHPVPFDGETPIDGRLINGPIRDLNLIFDPRQISGQVTFVDTPHHEQVAGRDLIGLLALTPGVEVDGMALFPGSFALGTAGVISVAKCAKALRVVLRPLG